MAETVLLWGRVAGAISALIALLALMYKPVKSARARRAEKERARMEFEARVLKTLDAIQSDVIELQRDRLSQKHDYVMMRGWCSPEEKKIICDWHAAYKAKGYNHLTDHYEQDIMDLPEHPAEEETK